MLEWIEAKSPNPFDLYEDTKARIQNIINLEIAKAVNHKKALKGKGSLDIDDLNKEEFEKEKKEIEAIKKDAVKDIVLILGSGPMSKVLAYDFAQQGVQGIDIGKGFEQLYNDRNYEHEI